MFDQTGGCGSKVVSMGPRVALPVGVCRHRLNSRANIDPRAGGHHPLAVAGQRDSTRSLARELLHRTVCRSFCLPADPIPRAKVDLLCPSSHGHHSLPTTIFLFPHPSFLFLPTPVNSLPHGRQFSIWFRPFHIDESLRVHRPQKVHYPKSPWNNHVQLHEDHPDLPVVQEADGH